MKSQCSLSAWRLPGFCPRLLSLARLALACGLACLLSLLLFFRLPNLVEASATGPERILLFDVKATFAADGAMEVSESIRVLAQGEQIQRGLFRTLPRIWKRSDGKQYSLHYAILQVKRDGASEPYIISQNDSEITIRMGDKNRLLPPGPHQYTLVYTVRNHFSRFADWDELYWNITGNGWQLPIDEARFQLHLPAAPLDEDQAEISKGGFRSVDIYTGYQGERGQQARILPDERVVTTAPLAPGQGLTVSYTWPRSVLASAPSPRERNLWRSNLLPTGETAVLWLVPLALAGYFVLTWWWLRPRGGMPEVIPLFNPPQGLSPGQLRYVQTRRYTAKNFAADLLNLVARGAMELLPDAQGRAGRVLRRRATPQGVAFNKEENGMLGILFSKGLSTIDLSLPYQSAVESARAYLTNRCNGEKEALLLSSGKYWFLGMALLLALPITAALLFSPVAILTSSIALLFFALFSGFLCFFIVISFRGAETRFSLVIACLISLVTVPFFIALGILACQAFPEILASVDLPEGYLGALVVSFLIGLVGYLTAPRYTAAGLERLALAKGLALYLGTAERQRFEALYPPEDSVERFEQLLPYALALGVGKTWANSFASYLASTGLQAEQFQELSWGDLQRFTSYSSRASSAEPRYSSSGGGGSGSGSSGSGSSGGGSGGGGGGGW